MFGAVHLEVMLIMRCVLHEFAKGTQGSSQQCLKITQPCVSSQIWLTTVVQTRVPQIGQASARIDTRGKEFSRVASAVERTKEQFRTPTTRGRRVLARYGAAAA